MLKRIFLVVAAVLLLFSVYVALQPSTMRIERSAIVVAPPAAVFAEVNDLNKWQAWSPWAKLDPNAKSTFEGPPAGEGAVFRWAGNDEVGEGSMTVIESKPDDHIKIRVDFVKPRAGTSTSEFTFKPDGPRTLVTWATAGEHDFISKAICVFMNPERMLGEPMEKGLASLKTIAEGKSAPATADPT